MKFAQSVRTFAKTFMKPYRNRRETRVSITFAPWDEDGNKVVKIISDYLETKVIANSKHQRFCHERETKN